MGLAVAILAVRGAVPEGLKLYRFPESDWAVFSAWGPLPALGPALGNNTGVGLSLGMLLGLAIGSCIPRGRKDADE